MNWMKQVSNNVESWNCRDRYLAENVDRNEDERGTCTDYQTNVNPSRDLYE